MAEHEYRPRARTEDLAVSPLGDELLIFDSDRNRAHSLNATAACVWRACDGHRDLATLGEHCQLERSTVELALDRLRASHLLLPVEAADRISRRTMLRRTAIAGAGAGVAIPIIRSISAPTPALAQTPPCVGPSGSCGPGPSSQCCSAKVCNAFQQCVSSCEGSGGRCSGSGVCCSGYVCAGSHGSSFCTPTG